MLVSGFSPANTGAASLPRCCPDRGERETSNRAPPLKGGVRIIAPNHKGQDDSEAVLSGSKWKAQKGGGRGA